MTANASPEIRRATISDLEVLAELIDEFAATHPAARHPRPLGPLEEAYFGPSTSSQIYLAFRDGEAAGFAGWEPCYDMFWAKRGGQAIGLFVRARYRGLGLAACLIAELCASIRAAGGGFLRASYQDDVAPFYERVAIGGPVRECHLSASAFEAVADLAGGSVREIVSNLPDPELNHRG